MAEYFLGHSPAELQRLALQAGLLKPITERMLSQAGLRPGMRVLDLGCGAGDVSFLAAELVGPTGHVVGIDRAMTAVQFATERMERDKVGNVSFRQDSETDLDDAPFDFAVGRWVLIYQADPASFVRAAAERLRPGGTIMFHEYDLGPKPKAAPPLPLFDATLSEVMRIIGKTVQCPDVATRLGSVFADAGLQAPDVSCERLVGTESSRLYFRWVAATYAVVRSLTDPKSEPVEIEQLATEFLDEVKAVHGCALAMDQWCAWATV